jgi:hypothetical protein
MPTVRSWWCAQPEVPAGRSSTPPRQHFSFFTVLVAWGEEGTVRERPDQDRGDGDTSQEHVEYDYLEPHRFERVGASDDHAYHSTRQEDYPRCLRRVYEGDEGTLERGPQDGRYGLAARSSEGEGRLDLGPLFGHVVADARHRQARSVHGIPDHHAAEGNEVPGRGGYDPKREQEAQSRQSRYPNGNRRHEKGPRHILSPARRGPGGEGYHTSEEHHDRPDALQPEDEVDHVPYRGELHEGAYYGHADVLLQIQPLVETKDYRNGHEPECQKRRAQRLQIRHPRASPQ